MCEPLCSGTALCLTWCLAASLGGSQQPRPTSYSNQNCLQTWTSAPKGTKPHSLTLITTIQDDLGKKAKKRVIYIIYIYIYYIYICIAILMLWLNLSSWILPEVSVEDLDFLCYRIQAHSALPTAGQWIWETRCWGKEFDYIWKACRPRLQTNVSKQPSYWHLDARFFYRTETGGSEGAK